MRPLAWFFCIFILGATAQAPPKPELDLSKFVQKFVAVGTSVDDNADLYDILVQYYQNPLDINQASAEMLQTLALLSDVQIRGIISYRNTYGNFLSLYELQAVPELDQDAIERLLPFVEISSRFAIGKLDPAQMMLIVRSDQVLEEQKGYTEPTIYNGKPTSRYTGSKQRVFTRYKMSTSKDFSAGITAEKDAGEQGVDFVSVHGQLMNRGRWKNIIVGDYQVLMGQGLLTSAGFSAGKGSEAILTTRRGNVGSRPYTSSIEGGFFRGATGTYAAKNLEITGLVSLANNDATLVDDETDQKFSSISNTGYHRTLTEQTRKDLLKERNLGLNLVYKHTTGQIGLSTLNTFFALPLERNPTYYNTYEFNGQQNTLFSLNFSQYFQNLNAFGEIARSSSGGIGAIVGLMQPLSKRLDATVLLRNYDKDFHSFYGNAFGENGRNINEKGAYGGLKYTIHKKLIINAFLDFYAFNQPKYLVSGASTGNDFSAKAEYKLSKTRELSLQVFKENKQKNLPGIKPATMVDTDRSLMLLNYEHGFSKTFGINTRLQRNTFQYATTDQSKGYLALLDANFDHQKFSLSTRLAYFDTDGYDARIYAYEKDVLYAFDFPAYYRQGIRAYALAGINLSKNTKLNLRLSRWQLTDSSTSFGSGLDEIAKPQKTDLKVQLIWRQ